MIDSLILINFSMHDTKNLITVHVLLIRYHVPRSFLNDGTNTLILFEEMGGNPSHVSFQTVVAAAV